MVSSGMLRRRLASRERSRNVGINARARAMMSAGSGAATVGRAGSIAQSDRRYSAAARLLLRARQPISMSVDMMSPNMR
jgi:hypothetical protein